MIRRLLTAACALALSAGAALAGPVELLPEPTDADGRVTLGEIFEGAGAAADVVVATRVGPSVVLDAGQLQVQARRAGLTWTNALGLRRIVVRQGAPVVTDQAARPGAGAVEVLTFARSLAAGETIRPEDVIWAPVQAHLAPADAPRDVEAVIGRQARRPMRQGQAVAARDLVAPTVVRRDEMVEVSWSLDGVTLSMQGRALENASTGQVFTIRNPQSQKVIEAVATGPGRAVTGPAAQALRAEQFASR